MNDNDVMGVVRDGLSRIDMETPIETIMASGTSRRRRRLAAVAGLSGVAAVAVAVPLGVAALTGSTPTVAAQPPAGNANPAQLAAFTLVDNANGTETLTLTKGRTLDPEALRRALAKAGVPALIKVGTFCRSDGAPDGLDRVITTQRRADGQVVVVITPSAMPKGAMLSIGYRPPSEPGTKDRARFTLVSTAAPLTCERF